MIFLKNVFVRQSVYNLIRTVRYVQNDLCHPPELSSPPSPITRHLIRSEPWPHGGEVPPAEILLFKGKCYKIKCSTFIRFPGNLDFSWTSLSVFLTFLLGVHLDAVWQCQEIACLRKKRALEGRVVLSGRPIHLAALERPPEAGLYATEVLADLEIPDLFHCLQFVVAIFFNTSSAGTGGTARRSRLPAPLRKVTMDMNILKIKAVVICMYLSEEKSRIRIT